MPLTDEQLKRIAAYGVAARAADVTDAEQKAVRDAEKAVFETCQNCGAERVYRASGYGKDLNWHSFNGKEVDGYLPDVGNLGGGDSLDIAVCLECGQAQGEWPVKDPEIEDEEDEDD